MPDLWCARFGGRVMTIRPRFPHDLTFDVNDTPVRIGDRAAPVSDTDMDATVTRIFGGRFGPPNMTLQFDNGREEDFFSADVRRIS
jgi:hypothetical protein